MKKADGRIRAAPHHLSVPRNSEAFREKVSSPTIPLLIVAALIVVYLILGVLHKAKFTLTILSTLPSASVGALATAPSSSSPGGFGLIGLIGLVLLVGVVQRKERHHAGRLCDRGKTLGSRGLSPVEGHSPEHTVLRFKINDSDDHDGGRAGWPPRLMLGPRYRLEGLRQPIKVRRKVGGLLVRSGPDAFYHAGDLSLSRPGLAAVSNPKRHAGHDRQERTLPKASGTLDTIGERAR